MKLLVLILFLFSFAAYANICSQDAQVFCKGINPDRGELAKCLTQNMGKLSAACAKDLQNFRSDSITKNPCHKDLEKLCADIRPEPDMLSYCLFKNESTLSPTCAQDFKEKKVLILIKNACAQDTGRLCYPESQVSAGALNKCLISHKSRLSPDCQIIVNRTVELIRKKNPCFDEIQKYCPGNLAFADVQACMEKKISVLSAACKPLVQKEIEKSALDPCYKDRVRNCRPGLNSEEINACLNMNEKKLSNSCRQMRSVQGSKAKKFVQACEIDRAKFCPRETSQSGMLLKCLRASKEKLTAACKELL